MVNPKSNIRRCFRQQRRRVTFVLVKVYE